MRSILLAYALLLPALFGDALGAPVPLRISIVGALVLLPGVAMGTLPVRLSIAFSISRQSTCELSFDIEAQALPQSLQ